MISRIPSLSHTDFDRMYLKQIYKSLFSSNRPPVVDILFMYFLSHQL